MLKKKQLIKRALQQPDLYTSAELTYLKLWSTEKKRLKKLRKVKKKSN